jgi:hypothetical protein
MPDRVESTSRTTVAKRGVFPGTIPGSFGDRRAGRALRVGMVRRSFYMMGFVSTAVQYGVHNLQRKTAEFVFFMY